MNNLSPELAQAVERVKNCLYLDGVGSLDSFEEQISAALDAALRLAAAEGAHSEAELHACRYREWRDGRQNAGLLACRAASRFTRDFGPAGDQDYEMTEALWCRYCKRKAATEAELAAARAACVAL